MKAIKTVRNVAASRSTEDNLAAVQLPWLIRATVSGGPIHRDLVALELRSYHADLITRELRKLARAGVVRSTKGVYCLKSYVAPKVARKPAQKAPKSTKAAPKAKPVQPTASAAQTQAGAVWVNGYTRKNGVVVAGYWRCKAK